MSFERPTLKEIIDRLDGETQSRLSVPQLRRSNAKVFDRVLAAHPFVIRIHQLSE
ncbi:MAG: hypothetical protein ACLRRK_04435 [Parasutterella sp.]